MLLVQELGESTGQLKVLLGKVQTQLQQMKSEGQIVKRVLRAKASGVKAKQTLMICANAMRILGDFSRIGIDRRETEPSHDALSRLQSQL